MARRPADWMAPAVAGGITAVAAYMFITWLLIRADSGGAVAVAMLMSASLGGNVALAIALLGQTRERPGRRSGATFG